MTKLLVSVRDAAEAHTALDAGVDLLDLKEPTRGALGAVPPAVGEEVVQFVHGRVPVSTALGELIDHAVIQNPSLAVSRAVAYVKLGLSGCAAQRNWPARWRELLTALAPQAAPVAVIYADGASVAAPGVDEILEAAAMVNCRTVLVDTALKNGRGLLDHWPLDVVKNFLHEARRRGLTTVVGGSLNLETIPLVAACGPDYVAVRGAACRGDRTGTIDASRIVAIRDVLCAANPRRLAGG